MDDKILMVCTHCNSIPSTQSRKTCFRCGMKLTPWNLSTAPFERQPEWPNDKKKTQGTKEKNEQRIDYTKFFNNSDGKQNN